MRFLQRVRYWEYRQLPWIARVIPFSNGCEANSKDKQVGRIGEFCNNSLKFNGAQYGNRSFSTMLQNENPNKCSPRAKPLAEFHYGNQFLESRNDTGGVNKHQIGENISRKDRVKFLVNTLLDLKDSKDSVYGALDAWVAWEQSFPIASLKRALVILEEQQQHHKVIQVIKWMLSKGQGTTMGTYNQLIRALDMDHRAEEAHNFWVKKIGNDLHSVPWGFCRCMISIYHRNNMLERLVKLFKNLEAFDRRPPDKSVLQKVADAYEMLELLEEKERVLEKYSSLFTETCRERLKKSRKASQKKLKRSGKTDDKGASANSKTSNDDPPGE